MVKKIDEKHLWVSGIAITDFCDKGIDFCCLADADVILFS